MRTRTQNSHIEAVSANLRHQEHHLGITYKFRTHTIQNVENIDMAVNKKENKSYSLGANLPSAPSEQKDDVQSRYQQDFNRYQAQIEKTRRVFEGSEAA